MKRPPFALAAGAVVLLMVGIGWGVGTWRKRPEAAPAAPEGAPAPANPVAARGRVVYQQYCVSCHGPDGRGDGPAAATLRPPPRDFGARPWRFAPTADAVRKATREGIPGTGMAAFRTALSDGDLDAVVEHVLALSAPRPGAVNPPSEDEQLLSAAGFVSLLGAAPPPLSLVDAKDQPARLSDLKGKLVLLHFWGTGCTHCVKEIPTLDRLEKEHGGRLKVLHVCTDDITPQAAQRALDTLVPGAVAVMEASGKPIPQYEAQALPTVWLIAPDGTAVGRATGAKDWTADPQTKLLARWLPR